MHDIAKIIKLLKYSIHCINLCNEFAMNGLKNMLHTSYFSHVEVLEPVKLVSFDEIDKDFPSFCPFLEASTIWGYSIVTIEVAFLFKIGSAIDSKRFFFNRFWVANTVLLEVQGLPRSCLVHNTYQQQQQQQQKKTFTHKPN